MQLPGRWNYRVGDIEFCPDSRAIVSKGQIQPVRPQTFDVLIYLVENRDRLVSKYELIDKIWRDVSVSDDSLVQCIGEIRRVLGDDARAPRLIRTVSRRGYQFIGAVEEVPSEGLVPSAALIPGSPGSITLEETTTVRIRVEEEVSAGLRGSPRMLWMSGPLPF